MFLYSSILGLNLHLNVILMSESYPSSPVLVPPVSALDVLVIGATPAGLAAALAYARLGLSVRIIESHAGISPLNGSVSLNARALELLEALQIAEKIIQAGHKISHLEIRNANYKKITDLDFSHLHHKYPFLLALPQSELEKILIEALKSYGVLIEFGTSLISHMQQEILVTCDLKNAQGSESQIISKIVVAAEGEFSNIRQKLKIGFGLTEYQHHWSLVDIQTDLNYGDATCCLLPDGLLYVQRIKNNLFRIVSNLSNAHTFLPQPVKAEEIIWHTERRVTTHQIRSYQYGRIFFVGDCAHQHLPWDGRDLSMGLEDAVTLAAMTMDQCLEQYHDHRYKANLKVLYDSERLVRLMGQAHSPFFNRVREWVLKNLLTRPSVQSRVLVGMSGLGF